MKYENMKKTMYCERCGKKLSRSEIRGRYRHHLYDRYQEYPALKISSKMVTECRECWGIYERKELEGLFCGY